MAVEVPKVLRSSWVERDKVWPEDGARGSFKNVLLDKSAQIREMGPLITHLGISLRDLVYYCVLVSTSEYF